MSESALGFFRRRALSARLGRPVPYRGPPGGGGGPSGLRPISALGRRMRQSTLSFTQQKRRKKTPTSGIGVTDHYDARLIYRKSRMPRYRRRRWRQFKNRVHAVAEKDMGTQQMLFNITRDVTNTTSGNQLVSSLYLYGQRSANSGGGNDMLDIGTVVGAADTTVQKGLAVDDSSKVMFQSGILDVTIRNASYIFNGATNQPDSLARLEVDIYELSMRKTAEDHGNVYSDITSVLDQNQTKTKPIGGAGTEIAVQTRGSTPFDFSYSLSRWGIKVWKKTKYTISNGDQITYQVRDPRRRVTTLDELKTADGFNKVGWTRCILIIAKLAPGLPIGIAAGNYTEKLSIGITRKYTFKIENYSEDRTLYLNY